MDCSIVTFAGLNASTAPGANTDEVSDESQQVWVRDPLLFERDRQVLQTLWLDDRVINAVQQLLRRRYPHAHGLHDTVTLSACADTVSADLPVIQCVHDVTNSHWLTISTVGCPADNVNVYCSMQQWPSERCFKAIMSYLKFTGNTVVARLANVSKRDGGSDCGLYAIAYAEMLLRGLDPVNMVFNQEFLRTHMISCLESGFVDPFPVICQRTVRRQYVRQNTVSLYCKCRTSYVRGDQMVACNKCHSWFHCQCVGLTQEDFAELRKDKAKKLL